MALLAFVAACVVVASLLFFVCFAWVVGCVVVGVSFSLRMIATKRKGKPLGLVLSSWVVSCSILLR